MIRASGSSGGLGYRFGPILALGTLLTAWGCVSLEPLPPLLGPADVPALRQKVLLEPNNGRAHLELGAALMTAGRCDAAVTVVERGRILTPDDPLGPLVLGQCLEEAGSFDQALTLYADFLSRHGDVPGAAAVEGRRIMAFQAHARELARRALREEEELAPADSETVGVLPFLVDGDPIYQPLSVGLAHMLTTDLALLGRFPLVERVRLGAILEELALPPERVDPSTAVRAGRLVRASRLVLGTVSVPSERDTRLGGNVVLESGELVEPALTEGELRQLLELQKEYSARVAEALGYSLSDAERRRMDENRPANLRALLAFSRGLMAEDMGDFAGAAVHFREALTADPQYGEAQQRLRGAVGADVVSRSSPGEVTRVGAMVDQVLAPVPETSLVSSTLSGAVFDIASHQPERALADAGSATPSGVVAPQDNRVAPSLEAILTIIITIPR